MPFIGRDVDPGNPKDRSLVLGNTLMISYQRYKMACVIHLKTCDIKSQNFWVSIFRILRLC